MLIAELFSGGRATFRPPRLRSGLKRAAGVAIWIAFLPACSASGGESAGGSAEKTGGYRLADSTSPYLRQHADNPVAWRPWGDAAFEKAQAEDKPIFLSVGYSSCYYCHVMEHESFMDEEVAEVLNEHFVPVKVDREQRPDVDRHYMMATRMMRRRGGWPNSVWLTPEGEPWMAATYLPKKRFLQALDQTRRLWANQRSQALSRAERVAAKIAEIGGGARGEPVGDALAPSMLQSAADKRLERFDEKHAGFGQAPKFPPHGTLRLLLDRHRRTGDASLLEPVRATLDAMWLGGVRDHLGGGFHRYSTDREWLVPHFEKMLYDNAQLIRNYTDAHAALAEAASEKESPGSYRRAVAQTHAWVERAMTSPKGGFYSSLNAGEVGHEGEYYIWKLATVRETLGSDDASLFADLYNLKAEGNYREERSGEKNGKNILHLDRPLAASARARDADPEAFRERVDAMRDRLLERRGQRERPARDDKVVAAWNGLMIGALARAGEHFGESAYLETAVDAADFAVKRLRDDDVLYRVFRDGEATQPGFLDDYAFLGRGLLDLHRATGGERWLEAARGLGDALVEDFAREGGGFAYSPPEREDRLGALQGLPGGGNMPGAQGVAALFLYGLADATGGARYAEAADKAVRATSKQQLQSRGGGEDMVIAAAESLARSEREAKAEEDVAARNAPESDAAVSERREPLTVDVAPPGEPVAAGESFELEVAMGIDEGWHTYGLNEELDVPLVPMSVAVEQAGGLEAGEVERPQAKRKVDPVLGQKLETYSGRQVFRVSFEVPADASPGRRSIRLKARFQACDDQRCLPPETLTLDVPVTVARST